MKQRLYSVTEIAEYLGRTELAIRRLVDREAIPFVRQGRRIMFDQRDIDRWIEAAKVEVRS